jgi:hypothetical protein
MDGSTRRWRAFLRISQVRAYLQHAFRILDWPDQRKRCARFPIQQHIISSAMGVESVAIQAGIERFKRPIKLVGMVSRRGC